MEKPKLRLVPWISDDVKYFINEAAYLSYLDEEAALRKEPLDFVLGFRYLVRVVIYGG